MDIKFLKELMKEFKECDLTKLELKHEGLELKLEKKKETVQVATMPHQVLPLNPVAQVAENVTHNPSQELPKKVDGNEVISPMVGTVYLAPSPDAPAYVKVGQKVKKGDVLCIIEAMKLMNDVESDIDGEVVEIIAKNEQMVQFGEPLFIIRP